MKCFLSTSPMADQSSGKKCWTSLPPATPSVICPYFPYCLPFHTYFSCPEQHYTSILFSPQLIIIHSPLSFFISSPLSTALISFLLHNVPIILRDFPFLAAICPALLLNISSLTRLQGVCDPASNPPSQLKGHLFDLNFTVFFFFFSLPVSIPVTSSINIIQPTMRLYLGPSNSFDAFLKDPLHFTPSLSELPASLLALSTLPFP